MRLLILTTCLVPIVSNRTHAEGDAASKRSSPTQVRWDLGTDSLTTVGTLRPTPGPVPPEFPNQTQGNQALKFNGDGGRLIISPSNDAMSLQFRNGDSLTITAWIAPRRSSSTSPRYIIGKGRTGRKGFRRDNQNWALRITPKGRDYQLSFLFATANGPSQVNWHRWTSNEVVATNDGWHHVAVTYEFGSPESLRGWIDGKVCDGRWDMGGTTTAEPIVDEDQVWIGSASGGSSGNSFVGALDAITLHRVALTDEQIQERYQRDESIARIVRDDKPVMPSIAGVPPGKVLHQITEGLPVDDLWPDNEDLELLDVADTVNAEWESDSFLVRRLPVRFDEWGIRSDWQAPVLLRVAADVELPTGKQRFLLRVRSHSRLWIDGKLVTETKVVGARAPDGEEQVLPPAEPPLPGLRTRGYRQQEIFTEYEVPGESGTRLCRVVLELMCGSKKRRTETGEVCLAIETENGKSFELLVPNAGRHERLSLEAGTAAAEVARIDHAMDELDLRARRQLASSQDDFWQQRHTIARQWADQHPPAPIPQIDTADASESAQHPIDAFLRQRIEQLRVEQSVGSGVSSQDQHFRSKVFPILQEHCLRCHGKAVKGGLRLDRRENALAGGDSGWAGVVPGKPDESELMLRLLTDDPSTRMPLDGEGLDESQINILEQWIRDGAAWPEKEIDLDSLVATEPINDAAFLRRASLDTIGLPPTPQQVREFLNNKSSDKRVRLIDQLLDDDRVADHVIADWLDLLAENPTLLNKSLNSTGPFRWFLHDALVDRKPIDRMITELIQMRGNPYTGGSAGFAMAGENDSPMAAKAHVLASGLLAIDLQCARCHDAPFHSTTQEDLFSIAAMLNRNAMSVPETSRVPDEFFEKQQRESMIEVTLEPGVKVAPKWSLARYTGVENDESIDALMQNPNDSRERLAALVTAPWNERFAAVIVNRTWTRLMGAGLVPSLNDWEHSEPSHPELLRWLAHQFVADGYDLRALMRLIMTSEVYSRRSVDPYDTDPQAKHFFAAPITRRMTAEQVVDSLFASTGRAMDCEELTFVHDGRRPLSNRLTLGAPERAWMFATLNNERDRPSLSLPKARTIVDVLQAFGWNGSRQKPVHERESEANVLQPGVLANGTLSMSLSRAAVETPLAELAIATDSPEQLVESLFLRFLSRKPTDEEKAFFVPQIAEGYDQRVIPPSLRSQPSIDPPLPLVHWFNHLSPRANEIQQEVETRVRRGPQPDPRLVDSWRRRYEDTVWSLINHDEFVWMP